MTYINPEQILLAEYGAEDYDHPLVHITYSLASAKVTAINPAARELMHYCAFLAPDAIPEEIFTGADPALNGEELGPFGTDWAMWDQIVRDARRYSLVNWDGDGRTLSLHPLVQAVVQQEIANGQQRIYAERLVSAMNQAFPAVEFSNWSLCERLLPQALACAKLIQAHALESEAARRLLIQTGFYLTERAQYAQALPLSQSALALCEKTLGPEHLDTVDSLNRLASLYKAQGNFVKALPLSQRALAICEKTLGPEHPTTKKMWENYLRGGKAAAKK